MDFSDDKHLAAAVAKNKHTLLGKRVSIAKSDPKGRKRGSAAPGTSLRQGMVGFSCFHRICMFLLVPFSTSMQLLRRYLFILYQHLKKLMCNKAKI